MPTLIALDLTVITEEDDGRRILAAIESLAGFEPVQYDLNQRGSPRGWDLDRAVVDLLTQRTQLFVVEGRGGVAMIATGKHGEPPTLAISAELDSAAADAIARKVGGKLVS